MKKLLATLGFILLASQAFGDPVDGIWKTQKGEVQSDGSGGGFLHVQISECGAKICGVIIKGFDKDGKNDPAYKHLNKPIIWDMIAKGGGSYKGGKIWAPDSDKTYSSKMTLSGSSLVVKGCALGGLICRGQTWTRVK
ncbi:MAG: DUF2147 domain-containing protein [Paracoccaceae bacterium]